MILLFKLSSTFPLFFNDSNLLIYWSVEYLLFGWSFQIFKSIICSLIHCCSLTLEFELLNSLKSFTFSVTFFISLFKLFVTCMMITFRISSQDLKRSSLSFYFSPFDSCYCLPRKRSVLQKKISHLFLLLESICYLPLYLNYKFIL